MKDETKNICLRKRERDFFHSNGKYYANFISHLGRVFLFFSFLERYTLYFGI